MPTGDDDDEKRGRRGRGRAPSPTERDLRSEVARRARAADAPEHVEDEITGNYAGEELAELRRIRAERDPVGAIVRLEEKHEDLAAQMKDSRNETRTELANTRLELATTNTKLGEVTGRLQVVPELISVLRESNRARNEIEHVKVTTTLDVDKAQELSKIRIAEEHAIDPLLARRERRIRNTKIVGAIAGLIGSWEFVKWIAGMLH